MLRVDARGRYKVQLREAAMLSLRSRARHVSPARMLTKLPVFRSPKRREHLPGIESEAKECSIAAVSLALCLHLGR